MAEVVPFPARVQHDILARVGLELTLNIRLWLILALLATVLGVSRGFGSVAIRGSGSFSLSLNLNFGMGLSLTLLEDLVGKCESSFGRLLLLLACLSALFSETCDILAGKWLDDGGWRIVKVDGIDGCPRETRSAFFHVELFSFKFNIQVQDARFTPCDALIPLAEHFAHVVVAGEDVEFGKDLAEEVCLVDVRVVCELGDLEDVERLAESFQFAVVNEDSVCLVPALTRGEGGRLLFQHFPLAVFAAAAAPRWRRLFGVPVALVCGLDFGAGPHFAQFLVHLQFGVVLCISEAELVTTPVRYHAFVLLPWEYFLTDGFQSSRL